MLLDERITQADEVVVPITYSSRLENGSLVPSRLSLMVFDVACLVAAEQQADIIAIAGEQSYSSTPETTGEALIPYAPLNAPTPVALSNPANRLINTAYQAEALADTFTLDQRLTLVGWGFHKKRIVENFEAHAGYVSVDFITADSVIDALWQTAGLWDGDEEKMLHEFNQRYGFRVDWPDIQDKALSMFAKREQRTQLGQYLGKSGWVFKLLSSIRGGGRYDDISPEGEAIMSITS